MWYWYGCRILSWSMWFITSKCENTIILRCIGFILAVGRRPWKIFFHRHFFQCSKLLNREFRLLILWMTFDTNDVNIFAHAKPLLLFAVATAIPKLVTFNVVHSNLPPSCGISKILFRLRHNSRAREMGKISQEFIERMRNTILSCLSAKFLSLSLSSPGLRNSLAE